MINLATLNQWRQVAPWTADDNVEQDLVLSRLIVEIANHELLGKELVFRGGTCLHKLWMDRPWRYSEDLDYVRRNPGGVGEILDSIREVAEGVGFDRVRTDVRHHPKARLDATFNSGNPMRVKVEMNTYERSPARPITMVPFEVRSRWFDGRAQVASFAAEELIATKIRALYQRRKGRDLFDMWLAVNRLGLAPEAIAACFKPYRPEKWTASLALENLEAKVEDDAFRTDLDALVATWPEHYTIDEGARVARAVIEAAET